MPPKMERVFRKKLSEGLVTSEPKWPMFSAFNDWKLSISEFPAITVKTGAILYHGTSGDGERKKLLPNSFLSTAKSLARGYALYQKDGVNPKIMIFRTKSEIPNVLHMPSNVKPYSTYKHRENRENAEGWLQSTLGTSFMGIGYEHRPQAFEAVRRAGFNGLYLLETDHDDGEDELMICDPERFLELISIEDVR